MQPSRYRPQGTSADALREEPAPPSSSEAPLGRFVKRGALFVLLVLVPVGALLYSDVVDGVRAVQASGTCPGAPPDLPPFPCSPEQYLVYRFPSAWRIMGLTMVAMLAGIVAAPVASVVPFAWLPGRTRWWVIAAVLGVVAVPGSLPVLMALASIVPRP
jgi:hypothetical protein